MTSNIASLQCAIDWLRSAVTGCLNRRFRHADISEAGSFELDSEGFWLANLMGHHKPTHEACTILTLAIVPHIQPNFFNKIFAEHLPEGGDFPEFGGVKGTNHRGILPTGETAQFILAGDDLEKRLDVQRMLGSEH